jgi:ketosteroid isomerase-like protein
VYDHSAVDERDVTDCDEAFFAALLARNTDTSRELLTDDFLIVDVTAGQVARGTDEPVFVGVVRYPEERTLRVHEFVSVVVGRTGMTMSFRGEPAEVNSRYTACVRMRSGTLAAALCAGNPGQNSRFLKE